MKHVSETWVCVLSKILQLDEKKEANQNKNEYEAEAAAAAAEYNFSE